MAGQQLMVLLWSYFSQTAAKFGKAAPLTEQKLPVTYTAQPLAKGISVEEFQGGNNPPKIYKAGYFPSGGQG